MENIKDLGQALSKIEQKEINGGLRLAPQCDTNEDCGNSVHIQTPLGDTCYNVYCGWDKQCHMAIC